MAKIETLTSAQWQAMRDYREAERREALSTAPIDHDKARQAIHGLYIASDLSAPKYVIILQSPMQCLIARGLMRIGKQGQLRDQLWDQLWDQLRGQLWDQLRDQLRDQLWGQLWDQLYQDTWFIGGWDAFWLAFYDFGRQIGAKYKEETKNRLDAYRTYSRTCGAAYFYREIAFVSDRPEHIEFDHMRRLHSADGAALRWRDGYGMHAWHGLRIPSDLIDKRHETTPQKITAIENAEHRRVAIEIYAHTHGPDCFVKELGAELISEDKAQGRPRKLYRLGTEQFIHVINGSLEPDGSRREFLLGADPTAKTSKSAIAKSYGRPASKYREAVRT